MDLSFINNYYIPVVLLAWLCVGYCIKHIVWLEKISNEYIPTMMLILGAKDFFEYHSCRYGNRIGKYRITSDI